MPFKPDASFFRKIVIGAIGGNAVRSDLERFGFDLVELERGATETKIWKEVKRKRMRIPDLVCRRTGLRVESRAKMNKPSLKMSHSVDEAERAWDFGMIDDDLVAFPVCQAVASEDWSHGDLTNDVSYYREKQWERFQVTPFINYFAVGEFRRVRYADGKRKGVVEASEYAIEWEAMFSTRTGPVRYIEPAGDEEGWKVSIENRQGNAYTWRVPSELEILVSPGQEVSEGEVFASSVRPEAPSPAKLAELTSESLRERFLRSHERTMRFTGVKLARLRNDPSLESEIKELAEDPEEDLYVRLEGCSYLAQVLGHSVYALFGDYVDSEVDQDALEAVICLGEVGTQEAALFLADVLSSTERPFFLKSAAAWALGRIESTTAQDALLGAFSEQDERLQEEALRSLVSLGEAAIPKLVAGLRSTTQEVAAGCAEALRRHRGLTDTHIQQVLEAIRSDVEAPWAVWLIGSLPEHEAARRIVEAEDLDAKVHYALSILWSFTRSWVARHWEPTPIVHRKGLL